MSKKNIDHLQHVKSSVVVNGKPKLPTSSNIVEGEIAVNYADGYETLSIKSSSGNIVSFSADNVRDKQAINISRLPQIPVSKIDGVTASADEINKLDGISDNVQTQLNNKAASNHTHNTATTRANGFMSSTDKAKLDGIESGANKYTLPRADSDTLGGVKLGYPTSGKNYAVSADTEGKAFVNVPWTDTKATLSDLGITATAAELNYMDGVSGNVQTQLNGKAASNHTHSISQVTNLQNTLDSKASKSTTLSGYGITDGVNTVSVTGNGNAVTSASISGHSLTLTKGTSFAAASHTHTISQISGVTVSADEVNRLSGITSNVQTQLNNKAASNHSHNAATTGASGFMSAADKIKLDGIAANANNYTLPQADSDTLGGVKLGYTTTGKTYAVSADTNGNAFVNVPWTDTKATLSGLGITATAAELNYMDGVTSNVQTQLNGKASKSTTLSGYGITDGVNAVSVTGGGNAITSASISGHSLTLTKGTSFATATHNHDASNINSGTLSADRLPKIPTSKLEGIISSENLPSYVDDVLEFSASTAFPQTGENGKIYVDTATNLTYRWGGSSYVEISKSLALGTTSSTAFRGDYGNTAYQHAIKKGSQFSSGLYKIATNSEGHVTAATAVQKSDIMALGIPGTDTKYTLPQAKSDTLGGVKLGYTTTGKNYAVSADTNGNAFVNVPWTDTNTTYNVATSSSNGLMSSTDKSKLDGIAPNANNYTLPQANSNTLGGVKLGSDTTQTVAANGVTSASSRTYAIQKDGNGRMVVNVPWTDTNTTYTLSSFGISVSSDEINRLDGVTSNVQDQLNSKAASSHSHNAATTGASGFMSATDKAKLDSIASGATKYVLPQANSNTLGGVKLGSDTTQTVAANNVSSTSSRTYAIQKDSNGKIVVNVPWTDTNTTYNVATSSSNGLMSSTDKSKLDGIAPNANKYTLPKADNDTLGGIMLGYTTTGKTYAVSADTNGNAFVNVPWTNTTYNVATSGSSGLMSATDKAKLDSIASGATKYVLPQANSNTLGGVKLGSDTTQTVAANGVTSASSRTYAIQKDGNGRMVVNVPWTDTNTTYSFKTLNGQKLTGDTSNITISGLTTSQQRILNDIYNADNYGLICGITTFGSDSNNVKLRLSFQDYSTSSCKQSDIGVTLPNASSSQAGVMTATDKSRLDSLRNNLADIDILQGFGGSSLWDNSQQNVCVGGEELKPIVLKLTNATGEIREISIFGGGSGGAVITSDDGTMMANLFEITKYGFCKQSKTQFAPSIGFSGTLPNATTSKTGLMSKEDKQNLDYVSTDKDKIVKRILFNMSSGITGNPPNALSHDINVQNNEVGFLFSSPLRAIWLRNGINNIWEGRAIKTIGVSLDASSSTSNGYMSSTQYTQLSNLYSSHGGKTYLQLAGGTVIGNTTFSSGLTSNNGITVRNAGLELYNSTTPFIDFHYGDSTADYTSRIIEESNGVLSINNVRINNTGQIAVSGAAFDQAVSINGSLVVGNYQKATATANTAIFCAGGITHNAEGVSNFNIASNGDARFAGTVQGKTIVNTSDARLKENVAEIVDDLDKVKDVDFKEFNFKSDESKTKSYGVIAQELESVGLGNLVSEDDKGMKSVNYIALLCLKMKQMEETMKAMQEEIDLLKQQLNK